MSLEVTLHIREATPSDRDLVLSFHRALYVEFRDEIADPSVIPLFAYKDMEATLRDDVDGLLSGRGTLVLIAERDGVPVGYITGHIEVDNRRVLERRGVIEDWLVRPSERGKGTGKALMNALASHFSARGCSVLESGTWAFNSGARKAHEQAGFHEIEIRFRKPLP